MWSPILIFSLAIPALANLIGLSDPLRPHEFENHFAGVKRNALAVDAADRQLQRRQAPQCESQCAWTVATADCATNQCVCNVIGDTSQQDFLNCLECAETYNVTYANILIDVAEDCGYMIPTGVAPAPGPSPTTTPCDTQCAWTDADAQCSDLQCGCEVIEDAGYAAFTSCVDCAESLIPTYASLLVSIASECGLLSGGPAPAPTQTGSSVPCENQCAWTEAADTCNDLECNCEVIQDAGQAAFTSCFDCVETVNASYASLLISVSSECSITTGITSTPAEFTTSSSISVSRTTTVTVAPSQHSSGQKVVDGGIGMNYVIMTLLAAIAGLFGIIL
jgi:hypothetical protein